MENVISNAERRAIRSGEKLVVPRIGDIYAAMPAMTGKLELEYEGELKGADHVAREIIRTAVARTYDHYFHGNGNMNQVVQWFDLGGEIQLRDTASAQEMLHKLRGIQGLLDKLSALGLSGKEPSEVLVSAAEFVLEGLYAHKRIGRSEERLFTAGEKQQPRREKQNPRDDDEERDFRRQRRPYN
jgi:magnesium chelatase subunit I